MSASPPPALLCLADSLVQLFDSRTSLFSSGFPEVDSLMPEGALCFGDLIEFRAATPSSLDLMRSVINQAVVEFLCSAAAAGTPSSHSDVVLQQPQRRRVVYLSTMTQRIPVACIASALMERGGGLLIPPPITSSRTAQPQTTEEHCHPEDDEDAPVLSPFPSAAPSFLTSSQRGHTLNRRSASQGGMCSASKGAHATRRNDGGGGDDADSLASAADALQAVFHVHNVSDVSDVILALDHVLKGTTTTAQAVVREDAEANSHRTRQKRSRSREQHGGVDRSSIHNVDAAEGAATNSGSSPAVLVVVDNLVDLLSHPSIQYPRGASAGANFIVQDLGRAFRSFIASMAGARTPCAIVTLNALSGAVRGGDPSAWRHRRCLGGCGWYSAPDVVLVGIETKEEAKHHHNAANNHHVGDGRASINNLKLIVARGGRVEDSATISL
jgi:hypothetical protein